MEDKVRGHLALVLRGGGRLALHAGPEEDPVLPGHGLVQYSTVQYSTVQYSTWYTRGTPRGRRPPNRMAEIGTPGGGTYNVLSNINNVLSNITTG